MCPRCGAQERRTLAPGFFECAGIITELRPDPNLNGAPSPISYTCHQQYQEGSSNTTTQMCGCGTFAIGACQRCGSATCGFHSTLKGGTRICTGCSQEEQDREEAARAAELTDRQARHDDLQRRRQEAWEAHPALSLEDLPGVLWGAEKVSGEGDFLLVGGRRVQPLTTAEFVAVLERGKFKKRRMRAGVSRTAFGGTRQHIIKGWVIGTGTFRQTVRGDDVDTPCFIGILEDGTIVDVGKQSGRLYAHTRLGRALEFQSRAWPLTAERIMNSRHYLTERSDSRLKAI